MAATISHMQHISALSIISPNTQLSRISPSGKQVRFVPLTRITSSSTIRSKHKPRYILTMEEARYHALLASEPIAVFPGGEGIRSDASNPTQTPNASLRRALITRISPATTPPVSMARGEQLLPINESGVINVKASPLDKELPPKPVLRSIDSPDGRGLIDMLDTDIISLEEHPVLQPGSVKGDSDAEATNSFKVASSLGNLSEIDNDFEFGTAVVIEAESVLSVPRKDLSMAKPVRAIPIHVSNFGSPIKRAQGLPKLPSDGSLRGRLERCNIGPTIRRDPEAHAIIMGTNNSPHPPRTSSLPKAVDSPPPKGTNISLPKGVKSIGQLSAAARLSRPTAASAARAAESKKSMAAPRTNFSNKTSASKSLIFSSASKPVSTIATNQRNSKVTPVEKRGSATGGSSAKSNKSSTAASIKNAGKGLKTRFSEIFNSNRRETYLWTGDNRYASIKDDTDDGIQDSQLEPTPTPVIRAKAPSKSVTTNPNSVVQDKSRTIENIRGDEDFTGDVVEKVDPVREEQRRTREEHRADIDTDTPGVTEQGIRPTAAALPLHGGRDDDDPTPPTNGDAGPAGHYGEEEAEIEAQIEPIDTIEDMADEQLDTFLRTQLDAAQESLIEAMAISRTLPYDSESLPTINAIIQGLAESIMSTRQVHMVNVRLRTATATLAQLTNVRSRGARRVIGETSRANGGNTGV